MLVGTGATDPGLPPGDRPAHEGFLKSMLAAVRRHLGTGSAAHLPLKAARAVMFKAAPILWHLPGHMRLNRLLARPELAGLRERHPRVEYKYLNRYLALHLTTRQRLAVLTDHLECCRTRLVPGLLASLFDRSALLWHTARDGHAFGITVEYPRSFFQEGIAFDLEGDIALVFQVDAAPASFLLFSFAPGSAVGAPDQRVVFVGLVQGVWGRGHAIKLAEQTLHYTPAMLLLVAAQEIAGLLDATAVVGVSARGQISNAETGFRFAYDELWRSIGATPLNDHSFRIPVPFPEKPIESIVRHHRSRVRRKREFKRQVAQQIRAEFASRFVLG